MTLVRLESFPFDSRYDGYDDNGYPVYDRAVGAYIMRNVFKRFFTDGVFSEGGYPFRITKASSGLAVTVNPGTAIIEGAMGAFPDAATITLATGTTAGKIHFAVFLRYDNNDEYRSIYLRTDASAAGGAVPEPVTNEANVVEYRIGYITVPTNSSDLSGATVVNEVGTSMCPYALPLFDIKPEEVLEDLKADALAAYQKYYDLLISAVDDTTAGYLQAQIDAISGNMLTMANIDYQAVRSGMGLGNTLGVLGVEYGGTGKDSVPTTGLVCSFSINGSFSIPTTSAKTHSFALNYSNVNVVDESTVSFTDRKLILVTPGFYRIVISGSITSSGGYAFGGGNYPMLYLGIAVSQSGGAFALPGASAASPFGHFASNAISTTSGSSGSGDTYPIGTVSLAKSVQLLNNPAGMLQVTFPSTAVISSNIDSGSIRSGNSSNPFKVVVNATVEVYHDLSI